MKSTAVIVLAALLCSAGSVHAAERCVPRFSDGWVRMPPGAAAMGAGFGRFDNGCDAALKVTAASSPAFADVSLHETTQVDGVSRMRHVMALELPVGGKVELRPGGLHLMLMQPRRALKAGDKVEVTFTLDDGRSVPAVLQVGSAAP